MRMMVMGMVALMILTSSAFAADFTTINDESVAAFKELMPQYKALAEKYGETVNEMNAMPTAAEFLTEAQALMGKYGVTMEQFPVFMQKISVGLAQAAMQQSGMAAMPGMFGDAPQLSEPEVAVVTAHSRELQEMFEGM